MTLRLRSLAHLTAGLAVAACLLWLPAMPAAHAQPAGDAGQTPAADNPPARVGRLSYEEGTVSLQPAGVRQWSAPNINRPLTIGDELWTGPGSRAEIEFGTSVARLAQNTDLGILNLSAADVQLRVDSGAVEVSLRGVNPGSSFEIDAPNAAMQLLDVGRYRIDVQRTGATTVEVETGAAVVTGSNGQNLTVQPGQLAHFEANGGGPQVAAIGPPDAFDRWTEQRDQLYSANGAAAYVSPYVVGYADLGVYGNWQLEPNYGYVWFPPVFAGWAPYRFGHWIWVWPWGWTWVDDAPWGFAPFHYGRWLYLSQGWCWLPPPVGVFNPVYAPALVAWIHARAIRGPLPRSRLPRVGWVPLAPGEVYLPPYRASRGYIEQINRSDSPHLGAGLIERIIRDPRLQRRYRNRSAPGALTIVPRGDFVSARPVAPHAIRPTARWRSTLPTLRPGPGLIPERRAVLGPAGPTQHHPAPERQRRRVIAVRRPAHGPPPFERQRAALRANEGRPLVNVPLRGLQGSPPARPVFLVPHRSPRVLPRRVAPRLERRGLPERSPNFTPPLQAQPLRPAPQPPERFAPRPLVPPARPFIPPPRPAPPPRHFVPVPRAAPPPRAFVPAPRPFIPPPRPTPPPRHFVPVPRAAPPPRAVGPRAAPQPEPQPEPPPRKAPAPGRRGHDPSRG